MTSPELEQFDTHPEWALVLAAYRESGGGTWLPRQGTVPGVEPAIISPIHGKLIALGMLRCDLGDRVEGLVYQLSQLGRQALVPAGERQLIPEWQLEAVTETA
ncbi:MAG: hypothetical protein ACK5HA_12895 [Planctomycetaceae bacterium]|jgi:hypothetical protein